MQSEASNAMPSQANQSKAKQSEQSQQSQQRPRRSQAGLPLDRPCLPRLARLAYLGLRQTSGEGDGGCPGWLGKLVKEIGDLISLEPGDGEKDGFLFFPMTPNRFPLLPRTYLRSQPQRRSRDWMESWDVLFS